MQGCRKCSPTISRLLQCNRTTFHLLWCNRTKSCLLLCNRATSRFLLCIRMTSCLLRYNRTTSGLFMAQLADVSISPRIVGLQLSRSIPTYNILNTHLSNFPILSIYARREHRMTFPLGSFKISFSMKVLWRQIKEHVCNKKTFIVMAS